MRRIASTQKILIFRFMRFSKRFGHSKYDFESPKVRDISCFGDVERRRGIWVGPTQIQCDIGPPHNRLDWFFITKNAHADFGLGKHHYCFLLRLYIWKEIWPPRPERRFLLKQGAWSAWWKKNEKTCFSRFFCSILKQSCKNHFLEKT